MKTELSDFIFSPSCHGHYKVTYCSPVTGKKWSMITDNMQLIDATKNADEWEIKRKDLDFLKYLCKINS